ncbi:MAG: ATP-binding cassette domain-containing protein [Bacteroidota bacterium]
MFKALTPFQRFMRMLKLDRKEITYVYVYAIFSGFITLSIPLGVQAIIGLIVGGSLSAAVILLISIVTIGTLLVGVLKVMQLTITENIQRSLFSRSSFEFAWRLPRIRYEQLLDAYAPELVNRFFDTLTLQKGLPKLLTDTSTAVLQIFFGLLLLSFYHPTFVAFSLFLVIGLIAIFYFSGPRGLQTSLKESKHKYKVAYWLEEIGRAVTTFKLSGQAALPLVRTRSLVNGYLESRAAHFRILLWQYGAIVVFQTLITLALLYLGAYLVINNQITIGQFVAAEIVIIQILGSAEKLIFSMETIYDTLTAVEKIGYVTDMKLEKEGEGVCFDQLDEGPGMSVSLRHLTFSFPDSDRKVIDDLSLEVKAGERVCLVGPNRSGKSTLIQMVGLLYCEFEGTISYNGISSRDIDTQDLRRHVGDYLRDEDLFQASILDNLWLLPEPADMRAIRNLCDSMGVGDFISRQPNGFHTMLTPGGRNLPASVRTKLLLARSLMGNPRLLALSDFGSSLAPFDRRQISKFLTPEERSHTMIAISNDPFFAQRCDRLLYLDQGRLILDAPYSEATKDERVRVALGLSDEIITP